jgi:hypothetical protein
VFIPVMTQHYAMMQQKLLYTGFTRGVERIKVGSSASGRDGYSSCSPSAMTMCLPAQEKSTIRVAPILCAPPRLRA